jgi:oligopeptide/dipeptide ABC transporter ATP-binding protein
MTVALAVHDVTVTYRSPGRPPVVAVSGVSMTLEPGRTTALIGESGSGKSTLGKAIARLQAIDRGSIELDGDEFGELRGRSLRARRSRVQMIFQDPHSALNPRRTILNSVTEPLRVTGESKAHARQQALEALDRVGITSRLADRYPHQLSGGQKQRVNIARALLAHPRVIVCDEPVSALDVSLQAEIINLLIDLRDQEQLALLFITHDISLLPHIADDVAVMYLSEIVESGAAHDVVTAPAHPYTMGLLAAAPTVGAATGYEAVQILGDIPDPAHPPSGCRFHTRCPFAVERCQLEHPELRPFGVGRQVACHLAEQLAGEGRGLPPQEQRSVPIALIEKGAS